MEGSVTEQDLLQEIANALLPRDDNPEGGLTTSQLADELDISQEMARRTIKRLLKEKRVEPVPVRFVDMTGRSTKTMGYRLRKT